MKTPSRLLNQIDKIIVHCSDSVKGTYEDVERWHVKDNGWTAIGYHYVIEKTGHIRVGRSLDQVGSHCVGQNTNSVGICLLGKDQNDFTVAQYQSALRLIQMLKVVLGRECSIHGHREFANKTCPNFDVNELVKLAYGR